MERRCDTVRSLGQASIGTDRPTRDKLKAAATARGLALSEYMRVLADEGVKGLQGVLPGSYAPSSTTRALNIVSAVNSRIDTLSDRLATILLDNMTFKPQSELQVRNALNLLSFLGSTEYAERRRVELEAILAAFLKANVQETRENKPVELELGYGTYE